MSEREHNPHDPIEAESEFEIEATSLRPSCTDAASPHPYPGARTPLAPYLSPRMRARRLLVTAGAVIIALALLLGSLPQVRDTLGGLFATPRPQTVGQITVRYPLPPYATPSASPAVLGAVPDSCPPGNSVQSFAPEFGPGVNIGETQIWFVGFDGPQATLHIGPDVARTRYGWIKKLLLVVRSDAAQPIMLSAQGMGGTGRTAPQFATSQDGPATTTLTFDPRQTTPSSGHWKAWTFYIYIPQAGCYFLQANSTNSPGTFFSAGE